MLLLILANIESYVFTSFVHPTPFAKNLLGGRAVRYELHGLVSAEIPGKLNLTQRRIVDGIEIIPMEDEKLISLIKNQIKRVCIFSEAAFALSVVNDNSFKNIPRFSCSSLIDNGLQSYLEDPEWEYLLYAFGDAFRGMEHAPTRIFFVNESTLAFSNYYYMKQIIHKHLECGVRISLVNDSSINQQSRQKRNISYFGPSAVLHATDQVDWDLSFSFEKSSNSAILDKYEYYRSLSFVSFELNQKESLEPMLLEITAQSTKDLLGNMV